MNVQKDRFKVRFFNTAVAKEYQALEGSTRKLVDIGLAKLRIRADELGKPLQGRLAGCKELKYRDAGIRVIFRIINDSVEVLTIAEVVAIGRRDKNKVFVSAERRLKDSAKDPQLNTLLSNAKK
ncbi:type II toxin-antitoxin system RelE/ParE family toxin [Eggerthella sp. YY7918]|uniref:type II toxin-antitoxin system RelE family toxin n=1 Tax=Eggerthella sp. (strain YY7918) TaxID=502558 RepID=UPI0002171843|nr:hypothetical protein [Eggerthella sp. YY7918]BAK45102.1 uncharacterized ACR [Eggerthella sp. YY7918]